MEPFRYSDAKEVLSPREAAIRLLSRRPDLANLAEERSAALRLAGRVGMRTSAVDVLAGFLGFAAASQVADLASLLEERVKAQTKGRTDTGGDDLGHAVLAAFELGWDRLPGKEGREAIRSLALLARGPVPRVILAAIPGVGSGGIEDALWGGFASLDDEEDRLILPPGLRVFVGSRPESREQFARRPRRVLLAVRDRLATCDAEDERYDEAAEIGFELASRLAEHGFAGSIARRMTQRLRRRGSIDEARTWSARLTDLLDAGHAEVAPLRGLALIDRGLLEMDSGRLMLARDLLEEGVGDLQQRAPEDSGEDAPGVLAQARLLLAQVLFELGDRTGASAVLEEAEVSLLARRSEVHARGNRGSPELHALRLRSLDLALIHALRLRGCLRLAVGETGAALVRLREAGELWGELQGEDHPDGAPFYLSLAQALRATGRDSEIDDPLEVARVLSGGEMDRIPQVSLPVVVHDLGVAAGDRGEFEYAETLLVEAAMIASGLLPEEDPLHAQILYTRGLTLLARGEAEQADSLFAEAERRAAQGGVDPRSPELHIQAARAWARASEGRDHYGEVARSLQQTEKALVKLRGPENTFVQHLQILRRSLKD